MPTAIYPHHFPQAGQLPAIVYRVIANNHHHHLAGAAGHSVARVQFDILAETEIEKINLAAEMKSLLDQYQGQLGNVPCQNAELINQFDNDVFDQDGSDRALFVRVMDFRIAFQESIPVFQFSSVVTSEQIEQSLYAYLHDLAKVFPGKVSATHDPAQVCIVYELVEAEYPSHLQGSSGVRAPRFALTIRASRYRDCIYLAQQVRERLQGYRGAMNQTQILSAVLENESEAYSRHTSGSDTALYWIRQDWKLWHR